MYKGTIIIVDERLMGRFGSNREISCGKSKYRTIQIIKTKIKAVFYDYFIIPAGKGIYFRVEKDENN